MATLEYSQHCLTVGDLKQFLEGVDDDVVIEGEFGEGANAIVWKAGPNECGPSRFFELDVFYEDELMEDEN